MKKTVFTASLFILLVISLSLSSCGGILQEITTQESTKSDVPDSSEVLTTEEITTEEATEELPKTKDYSFNALTITVPEDFQELNQNGVTLLVPSDYPTRSDNISFSTGVGSPSDYTEEAIKAMIQQLLGDVTGFQMIKDKFGDLDRVVFTYTVNMSGVTMNQESVNLFSSGKVYCVTFTNVSSEFKDVFAAAKESIKISE